LMILFRFRMLISYYPPLLMGKSTVNGHFQ
jgi:hypothetical protein